MLMIAAFAYVVLLGGTALGESGTVVRGVNAALGGGLIVWYLTRERGCLDRIDRRVQLALIAFLAACVLSPLPRQSLDAGLQAFSYAAAFSIGRGLLASPHVRGLLMYVFIVLSCVLTLVATYWWLRPVAEWLPATGWRVAPPLDLDLASYPWGHRHDLTLAVALLYPAWWAGRPSRLRRATSIVFGLLSSLIIVVDGSRTMWLALGLSGALILGPPAMRRWRTHSMSLRTLAIGAASAMAVLFLTGLAASLAQRASSVASLGFRAAMWGPVADVWAAQPLSGSGPGSFPWILQQTKYFDTNSWAPRHPDNATVQMLAEGGALGLSAMAILVVVLLPPILRSSSAAARWALVAFALATIGANPTDFGFLVVIAIAWAAYAVPRASADKGPSPAKSRLRQSAAVAALSIIGVAYGWTIMASARYDDARVAISLGRYEEARAALDQAIEFDPSMALYSRQRGALELLMGNPEVAVMDLEAATRLSKWDDLAWRTLAVALDAAGQDAAARDAVHRAISIQRSDPTNLLLLAALSRERSAPESALEVLSEVVQAWPAIVFAAEWDGVLPESLDLADVVRRAGDRWEENSPAPEPAYDQGLWLAVMNRRPDLVAEAVERSALGPDFARLRLLAIQCDPATIESLDAMAPSAAQSPLYWHLRVHASLVRGDVDDRAARIAGLMHAPISIEATSRDPATGPLNPLNENGQFSGDLWGYRRPTIRWPHIAPRLPSPSAGMTRWFYAPSAAVSDAGLDVAMPHCASVAARR